MNGFSKDWLALREPADHAAVNHHVRGSLLAYLAARTDVSIVDLGCGTGSNFRNLAPEINCSQSWTLVDNDTVLLKHAETLNRELISDRVDVAYCHLDFSAGVPIEVPCAARTRARLKMLAPQSRSDVQQAPHHHAPAPPTSQRALLAEKVHPCAEAVRLGRPLLRDPENRRGVRFAARAPPRGAEEIHQPREREERLPFEA